MNNTPTTFQQLFQNVQLLLEVTGPDHSSRYLRNLVSETRQVSIELCSKVVITLKRLNLTTHRWVNKIKVCKTQKAILTPFN